MVELIDVEPESRLHVSVTTTTEGIIDFFHQRLSDNFLAPFSLFFSVMKFHFTVSIFVLHVHISFALMNMFNKLITSWEPDVASIIQQKFKAHRLSTTSHKPFLIALAGIPGSGKTSSSQILSELLSLTHSISNVVLPMDGYHYPLSVLHKMMRDNPSIGDLVYRRGSPDTFDTKSLFQDIQRMLSDSVNQVFIPGFNHAKGDPTPNEHVFVRNDHDIVIIEGLYLLSVDNDRNGNDNNEDFGWTQIKSCFDMKIFIEADLEACIKRLKIRNKCLPGYTPEEIETRCDIVDRSNALVVMRSKLNADMIVHMTLLERND